MATMASAQLDSYMMEYHPFRHGENPNHTPGSDSQTLSYAKQGLRDPQRKKAFYDKVKDWLKGEIKEIAGPVVLAVAPGHAKSANPTGFVHEIVGDLKVEKMQLIRTKTVPKQAQTPGIRSEEVHRGTIDVSDTVQNDGKTVIILDDVWTSGNTLRVCRQVVLEKTNPKAVKLFAIGKTV